MSALSPAALKFAIANVREHPRRLTDAEWSALTGFLTELERLRASEIIPSKVADEAAWIQTFSDGVALPTALTADQVKLEDVARGLSQECRYSSQSREFYSVAAHSLAVAEALKLDGYGPITQFAGLVHDAHEAYPPGDVASPVKYHPLMGPMRPVMKRAAAACDEAFGLTEILATRYVQADRVREVVRRYDLMMLEAERRVLMGPPPKPWIELPEPTQGVIDAFNEFRGEQLLCFQSSYGRPFGLQHIEQQFLKAFADLRLQAREVAGLT